MPKLSDYVKTAADEYAREHANTELSARWIAEYFDLCGVQDDYPRQDLIAFANLVQKELIKKDEQALRKTRVKLYKIISDIKPGRKP